MNEETQALFEQTKDLSYDELTELRNAIQKELEERWFKSTCSSMRAENLLHPELPFSVEWIMREVLEYIEYGLWVSIVAMIPVYAVYGILWLNNKLENKHKWKT